MSELTELKALARKKRWHQDDAAALLSAWRTRGGTLTDFARLVGCGYARLQRWSKQLDAVEPAIEDGPRFIEVRARPTAQPFEVVVDGAVIRVPADFEPASLRRLLTIFGPC